MAYPVNKMSDEQLVSACLRDVLYLKELIRRYEPQLDKYISRKSNASVDDRKDILQNVFIKVYKNLREFNFNLKFSSWIYRIAYNEMIDWYRKNKRKMTLSIEDNEYIYHTLASDSDINQDMIDIENKDKIRQIVDELPDKYKEIVELRYFEDKSYEEISDILMIPSGTVAVRLNRVKEKLREGLKDIV